MRVQRNVSRTLGVHVVGEVSFEARAVREKNHCHVVDESTKHVEEFERFVVLSLRELVRIQCKDDEPVLGNCLRQIVSRSSRLGIPSPAVTTPNWCRAPGLFEAAYIPRNS